MKRIIKVVVRERQRGPLSLPAQVTVEAELSDSEGVSTVARDLIQQAQDAIGSLVPIDAELEVKTPPS